jgi:hypothetical protein
VDWSDYGILLGMQGLKRAPQYFSGLACLALLWGATQSHPAWATSFLEQPFPDSVKDAPVIVHGKVGTSMTDWGHERDGGKRIFTYWDLDVGEVLKGAAENPGSILRMREMGGEKDGVGMQVSGAATFSLGEDVVVFLDEKNSEGAYDVYGMMMGKYVLQKDVDGQEVLYGAGIGRAGGHDGDEPQAEKSPAPKWTLEALRRVIASQSNLPGKPAVSPRPSTAPSRRPVPVVTPSPAAPGLQTPPPEAQSFPLLPVLALGAAILGALWFLISRKR